MTINADLLGIALAGAGGALIGLGYFGHLWWTLKRLPERTHRGAWLFGGLVLRLSVALAGFYAFTGGAPVRVIVCLAGFMAVRVAFARLIRTP